MVRTQEASCNISHRMMMMTMMAIWWRWWWWWWWRWWQYDDNDDKYNYHHAVCHFSSLLLCFCSMAMKQSDITLVSVANDQRTHLWLFIFKKCIFKNFLFQEKNKTCLRKPVCVLPSSNITVQRILQIITCFFFCTFKHWKLNRRHVATTVTSLFAQIHKKWQQIWMQNWRNTNELRRKVASRHVATTGHRALEK